MYTSDTHKRLVFIVLILSFSLLLTSRLAAEPAYDLAVPVFKGQTQYPLAFKGLQRMLIDGLRTAMDQRVMPPGELRAALAANGLSGPVYSTQLKQLKEPIPAKYLLLNRVTEVDHRVVWKARLVQADRGYVEAAWQFQQHVSRLAQLKNQVVEAVVQHMFDNPPKLSLPEGNFPGVMALSKGLDRERTQAKTESVTARDKGFLAWSEGRNKQAAKHFKRALRDNPEDAEVLLTLNRIEQANGRYRQAKSYAEQAQRLQPEQAQPWVELGRIANAQERPDEAREWFEKARQLDAAQPEAHLELAQLYEGEGRSAEAEQAYRQAGKNYRNTYQFDEAVQAFGKAQEMDPRDVSLLLEQGDLHALSGRTEQAYNAYQIAKEMTPNNAKVYEKLGDLAEQVGERNKALVNYEKAVKLLPQHGPANFKLGDIYLKDGRPNKAIPHLEQARQSLPNDVDAGKALGRAYTATGQHQEAQKTYEELLGMAPEDAEVYTAYGDSLAQQGDNSQAQLQYKKAIKFDPDSSLAHKGLGVTHKALGQDTKANQAFTQAQKLDPDVVLPKGADVVHAGILNFVESFPAVHHEQAMAKMALVSTEPLIAQERGLRYRLRQALRGFHFRRADTQYVDNELKRTLARMYTLIDTRQTDQALKAPPYDQMTSRDVADRDYLRELSQALQVDALLFYRIVGVKISERGVLFNVSAMLFDQRRRAMWMNEAEIYYAWGVASFWNRPLFLILAILVHALLFYGIVYWLKGTGNLKVTIEQDERKEVTYFTIYLSKKADKDLSRVKRRLNKRIKSNRRKKDAYDLQVTHSAYWQSMVTREAQFKNARAGKYYVYLYGVLTDESGDAIGNYQLVQEAKIEAKSYKTMVFDLRRRTRKADIFVYTGPQLAVGAEIILNSQRQSRYIKDDTGASFELPVGQHAITIEYQNERYTEEVDIPDLQKDYAFTFDIPVSS